MNICKGKIEETEHCNEKACSSTGAILGSLGLFIVICLGVLGSLIIRKRKRKRELKEDEEIVVASVGVELQRTETLKERLNALTDNVAKLYEDFRNIESLAKEEALEETSTTALEDDNRAHNRYADIGQQKF